jgi:hypothetical protein
MFALNQVLTEDRMPSSAIHAINFDPARSELTITFATGRIYVYAKVPEFTFHRFARSESKGRFFNAEIRDKYRFRELTESPEDQDCGFVSSFREALQRKQKPDSES